MVCSVISQGHSPDDLHPQDIASRKFIVCLVVSKLIRRCQSSGQEGSRDLILRPESPRRLFQKRREFGFGYVIIRSPYTPYSIHLRGTIAPI